MWQKLFRILSAFSLGLAIIVVLASMVKPVDATGGNQNSVPNAVQVYGSAGCETCHGPGTAASNTPGYFAAVLDDPFTSGASWGGHPDAAMIDTDGDGFTNGEELQDPGGNWVYNAGDNSYNDTAYVSNPNTPSDYPPPPQILSVNGIANGAVISGLISISATIRYAGLNEVDYQLKNTQGTIYNFPVNYVGSVSNYNNPHCMGNAPGQCLPWNSYDVANGIYTLTVIARDRRISGGPQIDTAIVSLIQVSNTITSANLSVTKQDSADPALLGAPLSYTIQLNNAGPDLAENIVITDYLPAGVNFSHSIPAGPTCNTAGNNIVCNLAGLNSNDNAVITIVVTPTSLYTLTNIVEVSSDAVDPIPADNSYTQTTYISTPDLALRKTASTAAIPLGEAISYTLAITNYGPGTALSTTLVDTLIGSATVKLINLPECNLMGSQITCNLESMEENESRLLTIVVTPTQQALFTNTATVDSALADINPTDNTASVVSAVQMPDLAISKTESADPSAVAAYLSYTLQITNYGPVTATNVVVTDSLPTGVPVVPNLDPSCILLLLDEEIVCSLGDLSPGASHTLGIVLQPDSAGDIINRAIVVADEPDYNLVNNLAVEATTISYPDLSISKQGPPYFVALNKALTYTIEASNLGPGIASGVVITDILPVGITFINSTPGAPTCTFNAGVLSCTLGNLANGQSEQITLQVQAVQMGVITNSVMIGSNNPDPNVVNNHHSVSHKVELAGYRPYIYSISKDDNLLRRINTANGQTVSSVAMTTLSATVASANGLTTHPQTGKLWALLKLQGQQGRELAQVDAQTGVAVRIGNTSPDGKTRFSTMAFDASGNTLYAVTGDGSPNNPATLFSLSQADATATLITPLGNGNEGEAIAINFDDNLMYHASGYGPPNDPQKGEIFEAINLNQQSIITIPLSGDNYFGSNGLLYEGNGVFLLADCGQGGNDACVSPFFSGLYRIADTGQVVHQVGLDHISKGIAGGVDLQLAKQVSENPAQINFPLTYTIFVTNVGLINASDITITDSLPLNVQFGSVTPASPVCQYNNHNVICTQNQLDMGQVITVQVVVTPTAFGSITNTVAASSLQPDANLGNNSITQTTVITVPDLAVTKTDSADPATLGMPLTYTITVINYGPGAVTNIALTDTLPLEVALAQLNAGPFVCGVLSYTLNCTLPQLARDESAILTIAVTPTITTTIVNTVEVWAGQDDANPANNIASQITRIWEGVNAVYLPLILK